MVESKVDMTEDDHWKSVVKEYTGYFYSNKDNANWARAVGYGSDENRDKRYSVVDSLMYDKKVDMSILDIGCGLSTFLIYLYSRYKLWMNYHGIDINPKYIETNKDNALIKDVSKSLKYSVCNFTDLSLLRDYIDHHHYDWVIAISISDNFLSYGNLLDFIKFMYDSSKIGAIITISDSVIQSRQDSKMFISITDILVDIRKYTNKYQIVSGYLRNDITVALYK